MMELKEPLKLSASPSTSLLTLPSISVLSGIAATVSFCIMFTNSWVFILVEHNETYQVIAK